MYKQNPDDCKRNGKLRKCGFESPSCYHIEEIQIFHGMKKSRMICAMNVRQ